MFAKQKTLQSQNASSMAKELGPNDVLLGRGTGPNEHEGNKRFRDLVKVSMAIECSRGGRATNQLARHIVQEIKDRGGSFVRKDETNKTAGVGPYIIVPDYQAVEKTRQAFRFQRKGTYDRKVDSSPRTTDISKTASVKMARTSPTSRNHDPTVLEGHEDSLRYPDLPLSVGISGLGSSSTIPPFQTIGNSFAPALASTPGTSNYSSVLTVLAPEAQDRHQSPPSSLLPPARNGTSTTNGILTAVSRLIQEQQHRYVHCLISSNVRRLGNEALFPPSSLNPLSQALCYYDSSSSNIPAMVQQSFASMVTATLLALEMDRSRPQLSATPGGSLPVMSHPSTPSLENATRIGFHRGAQENSATTRHHCARK